MLVQFKTSGIILHNFGMDSCIPIGLCPASLYGAHNVFLPNIIPIKSALASSTTPRRPCQGRLMTNFSIFCWRLFLLLSEFACSAPHAAPRLSVVLVWACTWSPTQGQRKRGGKGGSCPPKYDVGGAEPPPNCTTP